MGREDDLRLRADEGAGRGPAANAGRPAAPVPSMPLTSVHSVVLDSETTGLDAATARLVEVAAIRMIGDGFTSDPEFVSLVRPDVAVPAAATAVHGIADADLAGAPTAAEVLPALERYVAGAVIVGHSIRYDLEVLRREAERSGIRWPEPVALDVRLLARAVAPNLADAGLDGLCAWQRIAIEERHRARGDALATGQLWAALIPLLRARGIRTLAEAEAASWAIAGREGAAPVTEAPARPDTAALERIDSYPYRRRVREVMSSPPQTMSAESTLGEAVERLISRGISSVFVTAEGTETGIVTERDVLRLLSARGAEALTIPLGEVRQVPLHGVLEDDFIYRAIGRMDRLGVRHLAVRDRGGQIVGAVTTRNLLRHRASAAMILGDDISIAADERALGAHWAQVPEAVRLLCAEEVDPRHAAGVVSAEIALLTRRAAEIGEARMREAGRGGPPVPYAVMVLGSAGRGESLLAADQDNAIVFASGAPGGPEDRWFEELGGHVADILDRVGVPYCKGGVMARNAPWRRSLADWKAAISGWVGRQRPEDLLNVDIFFDAVPVHGDHGLGEEVWTHAYDCGARAPVFWRALQETLASWRPPLGWLGFRTGADGRVDLKAGGLMPIFTVARIVSLRTGTRTRPTPQRLRAAVAAGMATEQWIEAVIAAHRTLLGLMLRQQLADIAAGIPPGPRVEVERISKDERAALRTALRRAEDAVGFIREGLV